MKICECVFIELTVSILMLEEENTSGNGKMWSNGEAVAGTLAWSHLGSCGSLV